MANKKQLKILSRGVDAWNKWYRSYPNSDVDLSGADLRGVFLIGLNLVQADLSGANLSEANLGGAMLLSATLRGADLRGAAFPQAVLSAARLTGANCSGAYFSGTDLAGADLTDTDLSDSNIFGTNLTEANLGGAVIHRANVGEVTFAGNDLRTVKGLGSIKHHGPSHVSLGTFYRSKGEIPEIFLRGCGLTDWEIEAAKLYRPGLSRNEVIELTYKIIELRSDPLIQFNSCFISYSSKDEEFARRIYSDLQDSGVRCWFAPEDMKIGDRIRRRLDDSIRLHDKLLLILSKASVASQWIEQEVETALEKEREHGCDVLFPVRLDDAVMRARGGWPALIRNTRHVGDFRRWLDLAEYQQAFGRLLNDLRKEIEGGS